MDFINHHIKRMNQEPRINFNNVDFIPKKNLSELEQLNNKMIESMRVRIQNPTGTTVDPANFQKMVNQSSGKDVSMISDLTKDFLNSKKKNFSD